jgi:hypothetical protein
VPLPFEKRAPQLGPLPRLHRMNTAVAMGNSRRRSRHVGSGRAIPCRQDRSARGGDANRLRRQCRTHSTQSIFWFPVDVLPELTCTIWIIQFKRPHFTETAHDYRIARPRGPPRRGKNSAQRVVWHVTYTRACVGKSPGIPALLCEREVPARAERRAVNRAGGTCTCGRRGVARHEAARDVKQLSTRVTTVGRIAGTQARHPND